MTGRPTASTITDNQLDQLYAELAALRAVARGYCPHCGRGDAAPTTEDWEQQRDRAQQLAGVLDEVLRHFTHKGHPGEPCLQTGWIREATVARWRAALYQPALLDRDAPEPAAGTTATQATDRQEQPDV
jgi:hypothetical protein